MLECIFTIDYEIYGNGDGSLFELVYSPAERLMAIFRRFDARFVVFVEAAELEMIESKHTDRDIDKVLNQIRKFYDLGFEIGLHMHPQWYNARHENGKWVLDYSEYNLCTLSRERVGDMLDRSLSYIRKVLEVPGFTPMSFRAGNWLFQPASTVARVLAERGIRIDSSVFKGGRQQHHKLDYRRALKNGYYWTFSEDVEVADPSGQFLEIPIYTQMVPFWRMLTARRISSGVGLSQKGYSAPDACSNFLYRLLDFARLWHPLKLDFCRTSVEQLIHMVDKLICEDRRDPESFRPIVAIGHTKDLVDLDAVDRFLSYLAKNQIAITTLQEVYNKCTDSKRVDTSGNEA